MLILFGAILVIVAVVFGAPKLRNMSENEDKCAKSEKEVVVVPTLVEVEIGSLKERVG